MYRNNFVKGDPILHSIDFNSLKKSNPSPIFHLEDGHLTITNHSNSVLLILGAFAFIYTPLESSDLQFRTFPFDSVPKIYHQFAHEKTFSEILTILKNKAKSIENIVQMMNSYPIFVCVLECWVRKKALSWIQVNGVQTMGNQQQILFDLGVQVRGPLLENVVNSLKILVKIQFEMSQGSSEGSQEEFGAISSKLEVELTFKPKCLVKGKATQKEGQMLPQKNSECGFLRRSKVAENQAQTRTGPQFRSIKKQRGGICQKCGLKSTRCQCNQLKRKGFGVGVTPKNGQASTSIAGNKSDPFSFGFLNEHNISKIRDTNNSQK